MENKVISSVRFERSFAFRKCMVSANIIEENPAKERDTILE